MSELNGNSSLIKNLKDQNSSSGLFFMINKNGHKTQDARQWIMDKSQTVIKTQDARNNFFYIFGF